MIGNSYIFCVFFSDFDRNITLRTVIGLVNSSSLALCAEKSIKNNKTSYFKIFSADFHVNMSDVSEENCERSHILR